MKFGLAMEYRPFPLGEGKRDEADVDVVDIKIIKEMQHRSLSFGEVTEQSEG